jgi:predicted metal-dependent peptidase
MDNELTNAFSKAKIGLISVKNSTFISTILFSLKHIWTTEVPTAAVDGETMWLNPDFFMQLTSAERIFLLAHEAWHVAFQHIIRVGNLNPEKWNQAGDYVINPMLINCGYTMPQGGLYERKYEDMSTKEIYDLLPDPPPQPAGGGAGGGGIGDFGLDIKSPSGSTSADEISAKIAIEGILIKAATQAKMSGDSYGDMPGEIKRMLDDLLNPMLPWNTILQNYADGFVKDDYTFSRPNRRFMPDFYLPSQYSEAMQSAAVAVDTSCSVTKPELTQFTTEINDIKEKWNPETFTVVDFDTRINGVFNIGEGGSIDDIQFKGGGGTSLFPVFKYFKDKPPNVLIVFSDLQCNSITEEPPYPVIWICINSPNAQVNFGTLIHMNTRNL